MAECSKGWADRCAAARSHRCRCACGGTNHGAKKQEREMPFEPCGEPFVLELVTGPRVGSVYRLRLACLGEPVGAIGVCYEVYRLGADGVQRPGYSFIFEGGGYDGFSPDEVAVFLEPLGFSPAVSEYAFSNVIRLSDDYRRGVFSQTFSAATGAKL